MAANMYVLTDDVILHILEHLDTDDIIAFAATCQTFRQISMTAFRKFDLSRVPLVRKDAVKELFRDRQLAQHIRELNLNNHCVMNWEMDRDPHLEEFIMRMCPQLEALHVLNCGMSFRKLHDILKIAPKLTSLSWSFNDLTSDDVEFVNEQMNSSDAISLENIGNLRLEILDSEEHIRMLTYLVLSRCKMLEELQVFQLCDTGRLESHWRNISFPLPSPACVTSSLQYLHSLTILSSKLIQPNYPCLGRPAIQDFIYSLVKKKSRETAWKKFWISPPIDINVFKDMIHTNDSSVNLPRLLNELHSVEALTVHDKNLREEFKSIFERINDSSLKNLHLCHFWYHPSIYNSILRTCGHALKFLSLFIVLPDNVGIQPYHGLDTLFSSCSNITKLDLLGCHFEENICDALSKLKHLVKIQLSQCAVDSNCNKTKLKGVNANLLTFINNCKNIVELDVFGCGMGCHPFMSNDDLMAIAELRKLRSLILCKISGIDEWRTIRNIFENFKFLSMLRISVGHFYIPYLPILHSKFLKHLAVDMPSMNLKSSDFWNHLSHATNLERLCIRSYYKGCLNVPAAVEMLKSLPLLHVLHMHAHGLHNLDSFRDGIITTLEGEKSDRIFCFEFLMEDWEWHGQRYWTYKKVLPVNIAELCYLTPSLALPTY